MAWLDIIRSLEKVSEQSLVYFPSSHMISNVMKMAFLQHRILSSVFFHCK